MAGIGRCGGIGLLKDFDDDAGRVCCGGGCGNVAFNSSKGGKFSSPLAGDAIMLGDSGGDPSGDVGIEFGS